MKPYRISDRAADDLRAIWDYIAKEDPAAADGFIDKFQDACEILVRSPHLGHRHRFIRSADLRVWPIYSYLIAYLPDTQPLEIVRVVGGQQDLPKIKF